MAPTQRAADNLANEGLADKTELVGDVMADVCLRAASSAGPPRLPAGINPSDDYLLATIHRAENTDDPRRLIDIIVALRDQPIPVILTAHPRLVAKAKAAGIPLTGGSLHTVEPYGYPEMIATMRRARAVVTDSGGLQKEAYLVGVPCTTVRTETEWVETVAAGWNSLDPNLRHVTEWAAASKPNRPTPGLYGSGNASAKVVAALQQYASKR